MKWAGLFGSVDVNKALADRELYRDFVITAYHHGAGEEGRKFLLEEGRKAVDCVISEDHVKDLEFDQFERESEGKSQSTGLRCYTVVQQAVPMEEDDGVGVEAPDSVRPLGACDVTWTEASAAA